MNVPTQLSPRVAALLAKTRAVRGRVIFAVDATGSRELVWDMACQLQSEMFAEVAKIGGLKIQLVFYRGTNQCSHTAWTPDAVALAAQCGASDARQAALRSAVCSDMSAPSMRAKKSMPQSLLATRARKCRPISITQLPTVCRRVFSFRKATDWWSILIDTDTPLMIVRNKKSNRSFVNSRA
jgi:hypothetical protein